MASHIFVFLSDFVWTRINSVLFDVQDAKEKSADDEGGGKLRHHTKSLFLTGMVQLAF